MLSFIVLFIACGLFAQNSELLKIRISEKNNLERSLEYVEFSCQLNFDNSDNGEIHLVAEEIESKRQIPCQVAAHKINDTTNTYLLRVIFPVSMPALSSKQYLLKRNEKEHAVSGNLGMQGEGLGLIIENDFYRADLTKNKDVEPQSHDSGQIRELTIKMGFNHLVTNVEDRVHWAPNFDRPQIEWYTTIAHWSFPKIYQVEKGPYQIRTIRQDKAPDHPEILLSATYNFYDGLPYFKFYSEMEMKEGLWLQLLRNDEMAMDSMFTHLAFERPNGELVDLPFTEMHPLIDDYPIENDSPWLCFYNKDKGFAFGSIRIFYDNRDVFGNESILYEPHTQIGEWLKGIKYWNRRLIHNHLTYVPRGNNYREENAYLVFKASGKDHLKDIQYWAKRLRNPLSVHLEYKK